MKYHTMTPMTKYFLTQMEQILSCTFLKLNTLLFERLIQKSKIANTVAEPENKIDSDFLKNQKSLYFTFLN